MNIFFNDVISYKKQLLFITQTIMYNKKQKPNNK
jgi:hypothetical protein